MREPKRPSVFLDRRLGAAQYRAVAEMRYGDARRLLSANGNEHSTGAMYLAGFVVECLLKAELLDAYPRVAQAAKSTSLREPETRVWLLCYTSHALDEMLGWLPNVLARARKGKKDRTFLTVCAQWKTNARYSPMRADPKEARKFLAMVEEIRECIGP